MNLRLDYIHSCGERKAPIKMYEWLCAILDLALAKAVPACYHISSKK